MKVQKRLEWCMRHGNMTVADLARWFGRPDPTVRGWIAHGGGVGGPVQDVEAIERDLVQLETAIKEQRGFPVPRLSPLDRITHLEACKAGT